MKGDKNYAKVEKELTTLLKQCGFQSNITSLKEWLELMTVTGIVHGCTLPYTRFVSVADVLKWRNCQSDT